MTTKQAGRKGGLARGPTKARKTAAEAARRRGVMARRIKELEVALFDLLESSGWAVDNYSGRFDRAWKHAEKALKAKEVGR